MRKIVAMLALVFCFALPLFVTGCAGSSTSESTGEYVDDAVITSKVKAELAGDKLVSIFNITVETFKGVVQLSGFVNSREQADEAVRVAKTVKGVREVKDSLIVKGQ